MLLAIATASSARLRQYSAFGAQPMSGSVTRRTDSRSTRGREVASSSSAVVQIARRVLIGGSSGQRASGSKPPSGGAGLKRRAQGWPEGLTGSSLHSPRHHPRGRRGGRPPSPAHQCAGTQKAPGDDRHLELASARHVGASCGVASMVGPTWWIPEPLRSCRHVGLTDLLEVTSACCRADFEPRRI
jgi:hypothetical protein